MVGTSVVKNTFIVPEFLERTRVDVALSQLMDGTRSHAQTLIKAGRVALNGVPVTATKQETHAGDLLVFEEYVPDRVVASPRPLDVLYEDAVVIVLNKPAGLVVHPAPGHHTDTLVNALVARDEAPFGGKDPLRPGIVHRLDKDTSGLIVVAKTSAAHEALAQQFRPFQEAGETRKRAGRTYMGLVYGHPNPSKGRMQNNLGRHRTDRQRWIVCPSGKQAITDYELVREWSFLSSQAARSHPSWLSLLQFHLLTGRTHQIRVHCEHAGFPLVGDPIYTTHAPHKGTWPTQISAFHRQALHAVALQFIHPITQERMVFESPLPEDITKLIQALDESCTSS